MLVNKDLLKNKIKDLNVFQKGELLWDINKDFYVEKPVSVSKFYKDNHFLGKSFVSKNGLIIYPFWQQILSDLYPHPLVRKYNELVIEAPIGSGKSYASVLSILYELYRVNCLKNPIEYFELGPGTMIIFIFFSLNLQTANINWNYAKAWLSNSPYFNQFWQAGRAKQLPDGTTCIIKDKDLYINVGSQMQHGISRAIHSFVLDESNFFKISGQDKENYESLTARVVSRFPNKDGVSWIVSSAESDGSFMDTVKEQVKNVKKTWVIPCPPQWIIKGRNNFNSEEFEVFAGDIVRDAFIVNDETRVNVTPDMELIKVPMNFYDVFDKHLIRNLRDLANVRTSSTSNLFKSKDKVSLCFSIPNRVINPKNQQPVEIIFLDEKDERDTLIAYFEKYIDYFKNPMNKQCLRFVHLDLGRTKDKLGIACSYATYTNEEYYRTPTEISRNSERFYYTDWLTTIKAKKGQQIPYYKVHNFFVWLRDICGYNIELITTDQREGGAKLRQDLNISGFNVDYLSVDRDKIPYDVCFEIVQEGKVIAPKNNLLYLELTHLKDDGNKIDHPTHFNTYYTLPTEKNEPQGEQCNEGSKDLSDAWAGSLFLAHKAEKIFDFTKFMDSAKSSNSISTQIIHKNRVEQFSNKFYTNYYG